MSVIKFSQWQDLNGNEVANSSYPPGLVLVKTQTIGTAVSSVTVTGAFSATFDNYRVTLSNPAASAADSAVSVRFGSTTTGYYGSAIYQTFTTTTPTVLNRNNGADFYTTITDAGNAGTFLSLDIHSPFLSKRTGIMGVGYGYNYTVWCGGVLANTTSYTAFTVLPNSGTLTGGIIRVYGYNNG